MKTRKLLRILVLIVISQFLYSCAEPVPLNGHIEGYVTEDELDSPLQGVFMKIISTNDTTLTGSDRKYLFRNLPEGTYEIEAFKQPYEKTTKSATVKSGETNQLNFSLHKIPYPLFSNNYLDFGFDLTTRSFTIANTGTGTLNYSIITSKSWINASPNIGEVTTEPDTV